jgi:cytochrome c-type biogenesis protein CcmF
VRDCGELSLLVAFVGAGFASFALLAGARRGHRGLLRAGVVSAVFSLLGLLVVAAVLAVALATNDFRLAYVAQYSSRLLPWHYSLSALWVGQAGSLLVWAFFSGLVTLVFAWWPTARRSPLRAHALGILMANVCFLVAVMVFAADPMEGSLAAPQDGVGLSPLLQHPAMLIHPPVVFLGYALWTVPLALAISALVMGETGKDWIKQVRPWALAAWAVLGGGIFLGAHWAYEELGWGGYWAWDPVENGSLIPWLMGTALIHALMSWQYRGLFKRTTVALSIMTFAFCNFASFLTRSGVFSSLHAFSASPIGGLFLALMLALVAVGGYLLFLRNRDLQPDTRIHSVLCRESLVLTGMVALLLLTGAVVAGTVSGAVSSLIAGRAIFVGPAYYNGVLIPTGLVLVASVAVVPLLRWGRAPTVAQRAGLLACLGVGASATIAAYCFGVRQPICLAVTGLAALAAAAFVASIVLDVARASRGTRGSIGQRWSATLSRNRTQYAGLILHFGFVSLALGVAGSALGTRQRDVEVQIGQTVSWAGCQLRLERIRERPEREKLLSEVELAVLDDGRRVATLVPAHHYHPRSNQWTTEVAIHSRWRGDVYVIPRTTDNPHAAALTLVDNPLMRWLWLSGGIFVVGTLWRLWPIRARNASAMQATTTPRSANQTRRAAVPARSKAA